MSKAQNMQSVVDAVLIRSNSCCELCDEFIEHGSGGVMHHVTYKNVGNDSPEDFLYLCSLCHRKMHIAKPNLRRPNDGSANINYLSSVPLQQSAKDKVRKISQITGEPMWRIVDRLIKSHYKKLHRK